MAELRAGNLGGNNPVNYAGDDESDMPRRQLRKPKAKAPGIKRRTAVENALSVSLIIYVLVCIASLFAGTHSAPHEIVDPPGRLAQRHRF